MKTTEVDTASGQAQSVPRKRGRQRRFRRAIAWLHRWIGAILGVPFVILGFTGTILVFEDALDRYLNPHLDRGAVTQHVMPNEMLQAASDLAPEFPEPSLIRRALPDGGPAYVDFYIPNESGHEDLKKVTVDPMNGEPLEIRQWGGYAMSWIYYLHMAFRAGEGGEFLVGIIGAVLSLMLIIGLYLWWPRRGQWKSATRPGSVNGWYATSYRWHKVFGAYTLVLLLLVSATGAGLVFFDPIVRSTSNVLPMAYPYTTQSTATGTSRTTTADVALTRATELYPKARWERIVFPDGESAAWLVMLYSADESGRHSAAYPDISVWVDQYSGEVVADYTWARDARIGDKIMWSLFPLHNGSQLGFVGRLLIAVSGIVPLFFLVTGIVSWLLKPKRAKRRQTA